MKLNNSINLPHPRPPLPNLVSFRTSRAPLSQTTFDLLTFWHSPGWGSRFWTSAGTIDESWTSQSHPSSEPNLKRHFPQTSGWDAQMLFFWGCTQMMRAPTPSLTEWVRHQKWGNPRCESLCEKLEWGFECSAKFSKVGKWEVKEWDGIEFWFQEDNRERKLCFEIGRSVFVEM
jgi:hypothetical protein